LLTVVELLGLIALIVDIIASLRDRRVAYAITAGILVLEVVQWGLSKAALARVPRSDRHERYASTPLGLQQRIVELNLVVSACVPVWLALILPSTTFAHQKVVLVVLLEIAFAPGWLSLWRVRRNHSWLAISRIPANPRRQRDA
jgi:hypothetical protein